MAIAGVAWALPGSTGFFSIQKLIVSGSSSYQVLTNAVPNSPTTNPFMCSDSGRYVILSTLDAPTKDIINKTLMAAFLAGRKVSLTISDTVCTGGSHTGFPVYTGVTVDSAQ